MILNGWDFRNNLWSVAYLITQGHSPYDIAALYANANAVWFPPLVGIAAPLGYLPLRVALAVWTALNVGVLLLIIWRSLDAPSPAMFGAAALAVFMFPPVYRHLNLGQVDILLMGCALLAAHHLQRGNIPPAAFFTALMLTKPQLAILSLPALLIQLGFIARLKFSAWVMTFAALTLTPFFIASPNWFVDFIANQQNNSAWIHPSALQMLNISIVAWLIIYLAALVHLRASRMDTLLAWTTIITPYIWSWNFVLLIPYLLRSWLKLDALARVIFLALYAALVVGIYLRLASGNTPDHALWFIPPACLMLPFISASAAQFAEQIHHWTLQRARFIAQEFAVLR